MMLSKQSVTGRYCDQRQTKDVYWTYLSGLRERLNIQTLISLKADNISSLERPSPTSQPNWQRTLDMTQKRQTRFTQLGYTSIVSTAGFIRIETNCSLER